MLINDFGNTPFILLKILGFFTNPFIEIQKKWNNPNIRLDDYFNELLSEITKLEQSNMEIVQKVPKYLFPSSYLNTVLKYYEPEQTLRVSKSKRIYILNFDMEELNQYL